MFSATIGTLLIMGVTLLTILLAVLAVFHEYRKAQKAKLLPSRGKYKYRHARKVAILIASKDGEKTIAASVMAARATRRQVFVVSDGSIDNTGAIAKAAGAHVLALKKNVGKPAALHQAYHHFNLSSTYDAIAILDDDVRIEPDFIRQTLRTMNRDTAIAVGRNITDWPNSQRWNMWLAARSYSYWMYQLLLRPIQSSYNVMNCISGSNSLYRTQVLDQVLREQTPYIVDDTFWTLETHRLQLGTITYSPKAHAWLQDPTNFKDWYKQNLRWMWGTFQGILGHKIGTKANAFHVAYIGLMLDWIIYVASGPLTLWVIWHAGWRNLPLELLLLASGYAVWVAAAAAALKRPRLLLFVPAIIVADFLFRWIMVHSLIKALRQPTVEACVWESPERFAAANPLAKV